jgi:hypothetical protein
MKVFLAADFAFRAQQEKLDVQRGRASPGRRRAHADDDRGVVWREEPPSRRCYLARAGCDRGGREIGRRDATSSTAVAFTLAEQSFILLVSTRPAILPQLANPTVTFGWMVGQYCPHGFAATVRSDSRA